MHEDAWKMHGSPVVTRGIAYSTHLNSPLPFAMRSHQPHTYSYRRNFLQLGAASSVLGASLFVSP